MVRIIVICYALFIGGSALTQNYGDKKFYLIDSLDLDQMYESDRLLLDSLLIEVHSTKDELRQIESINFFVDESISNTISESYNALLISFIEKVLTRGVSEELENEYFKYLGISYSNQGYFEEGQGHFLAGIAYCEKAISLQKKIGHESRLASTYVNLGTIYYGLQEYESALSYFNLARSIQEKLNDPIGELKLSLNNIAVVYDKLGQTEESIEMHLQLIEIAAASGDKNAEGRYHNNVGGTLGRMGEFDRSLYHLLKAETLFTATNNVRWLSYNYNKIGQVYKDQGKVDLAISAALKGEKYAIESNVVEPLLRNARLLYELYKDQGNKGLALGYFETYQRLNDSLSIVEIQLDNVKKDLQFDFEREQLLLKNEMARTLEIERLDQKQKNTITTGILILLVIVFVFALIFFYRMRLVSSQKKVIEKQNSERKTLLKEIHHRVKNNFQIVSSILRLQSHLVDSDLVKESFEDAVGRIHSMSAVHELIYKSEDFSEINPREYFLKLTNEMRSYTSKDSIAFTVNSEIEVMDLETLVPLGIAVNELITNSIKYAFVDQKQMPEIKVELKYEGDAKMLIYQDNGIGVEFDQLTDTFGIELISTIIEQIDGKIQSKKLSSGAYFKFSFT